MISLKLEVPTSILTTVGLSWYISFLYPQAQVVRLCVSSLGLGEMYLEVSILK
jgi:hypothetical protein